MADKWMDSTGQLGQNNYDCAVGDTIKICHAKWYNGAESPGVLTRGFRLAYPNLGELIEDSSVPWNCVKYKHNRSGKQIIEFVEDVAFKRSTLEINGSVRLHDHASIPMGGPAYATYYSEEEGA